MMVAQSTFPEETLARPSTRLDPTPTPAVRLPAATTVGVVRLTVSDLPRSQTFYERVLGLESTPLGDGGVALYAENGRQAGVGPLVQLHGDPSAPARSARATGLFHLASLFPDHRALAFALARVAHNRWAAGRRLRPPRQRGVVPLRSGRQRNRALPRPAARRVALPRRAAADGDPAARPRRRARRARGATALPERARPPHAWVTFTSRCPNCARPRPSMPQSFASTPSCGATPGRCSSRPAAITTTSGSTLGTAPAPRLRRPDRWPAQLRRDPADEASLQAVLARMRAAGIALTGQPEGTLVHDPSGNGLVLRTA